MNTSAIPTRSADRSVAAAQCPHVMYVIDQLPPNMGGAEWALLRTIEGLASRGWRCTLAVLSPFSPQLVKGIPACVTVFPLTNSYGWNAFLRGIEFVRFLRREKVDVVHTFFESSDIWAGTLARCFSPAKVIWSRRDMGILREPKHRVAYRLLSWVPDHTVTVSEEVRQFFLREERCRPDAISTVHNGVALPSFSPEEITKSKCRFGILPDTFWIAALGNLRPVKGIDTLLKAAGHLKAAYRDFVITIIGGVDDEAYYDSLCQLVTDLGLENCVKFTGSIPDGARLIGGSDLFVLPSRSEGFSNALIEAMAVGLPIIATRVGGNGEAVQDGVSGFLVDVDDDVAMAHRIAILIEDRRRASEMGRIGRQLVEARFTAEKMVEKTIEVYDRLLHPATKTRTEVAS